MSEGPKKIVITNADLESVNNQARVQQMEDAQKIALVRPVGAPSDMSKGASGGMAILYLSGAGLAGGVVAFGLQKMILPMINSSNTTATNLTFSFILAFGVGLVVALALLFANPFAG